jgi:hypothetical protein
MGLGRGFWIVTLAFVAVGLSLPLLAQGSEDGATSEFATWLLSLPSKFNKYNGAINASATVVMAVLTAAIVYIAYLQRKVSLAQVDHMARIDRAYLFVSAGDVLRPANGGLSIAPKIFNRGKTPGVLLEVYAELRTESPRNTPSAYNFLDAQKITEDLIISPNEPFLLRRLRLRSEQADHYYFYGYVRYRDIFQSTHTTFWSTRSTPVDGGISWALDNSPGWDYFD